MGTSSASTPEKTFIFAPGLTYDCVMCGKCCSRGWTVHIEPEAYNRLRKTPLYEKMKAQYDGEEMFKLDLEKRQCTMKMVDNHCVMVNDKGLCAIHAEMGLNAKPLICRWYPFILSPTPEGIFVGVEFGCRGVQEGAGPALEQYEGYLEGMSEEFIRDTLGADGVTLYGDLRTNYQGYKIFETFVCQLLETEKDTGTALWKAFMTLAMLVVHMGARTLVTPPEIAAFLEQPVVLPFERDDVYLSQEFHYAMYLVTLLETPDQDKRDSALEALLEGAMFDCSTLHTNINVKHLKESMQAAPAQWKEEEYSRYIKHLVWTKTLLKPADLLGAMAMLNIINPLFDWYMHASALSRNTDAPELQDARLALTVAEGAIKHDVNDAAERYSRSFGESILKQIVLFLDPVPGDEETCNIS